MSGVINPDSQWRVDCICGKCGSERTTVYLSGDEMVDGGNGYYSPSMDLHCAFCGGDITGFGDVDCYDEGHPEEIDESGDREVEEDTAAGDEYVMREVAETMAHSNYWSSDR